ncbi:MAG TPA: hypothetical protein VMM36_01525 [Opitutaceae bacterium]|nr:hypothetical protein [Opitutaceae bacterium]
MKKLAMILTLIAPHAAEAQMASMSTLQDLPSVAVSVRAITPDGKGFGVKAEDLTRVVTEALTAAGVKVAPADADGDVSELPNVEITAIVNRLSGQGHIYTLRLALRELVELKRETKNLVELGAITWEKETQGYTSSPDRIVASATTLAERFATEWRAAN